MFQYHSLNGLPNLMRKGQDKVVTKNRYPQYFKLVLRSRDRDAGSTKSHAKFSNVKMPDSLGENAVFMVESFQLTFGDDAGIEQLEVHMPELMQPLSWSSRTKNVTDLICVTDSFGSYTNGSCNVDGLGVPILDRNFFRNNQLSIVITTPENESGYPRHDEDQWPNEALRGEWVLVAYIVSLDETVPM